VGLAILLDILVPDMVVFVEMLLAMEMFQFVFFGLRKFELVDDFR
jgi:hypothetical protein